MSTNTDITTFLTAWTRAEQSGDTTVLGPLLTDDFVGVGPVGFVLDRSGWLQRLESGLTLDQFSLDETHVRDYGDTAVVVGRQNQQGHIDGNPLSGGRPRHARPAPPGGRVATGEHPPVLPRRDAGCATAARC